MNHSKRLIQRVAEFVTECCKTSKQHLSGGSYLSSRFIKTRQIAKWIVKDFHPIFRREFCNTLVRISFRLEYMLCVLPVGPKLLRVPLLGNSQHLG